jgi:hypothetical protein
VKTPDAIVKRAAIEIAAGRHWRAKEILRGAIASNRVEPAILQAYGELLESLGDRFEAGKYLFLSGVREPGYAAAISLFLDRQRKNTSWSLIASFPTGVRRLPFERLPATVQQELQARSIGADRFEGKRWSEGSPRRITWLDSAAGFGAVIVFLIFVASLIIGVVTLSRWAFGLIFR